MYDERGNFITSDIEKKIRNGLMTNKMVLLMIIFSFYFAVFTLPTIIMETTQGIF